MNMPIDTPKRSSPVESLLRNLPGSWREVYGMPTLAAVDGSGDEKGDDSPLAIADFSCLPQWGVKGADAASWLEQQGLPIPAHPNSWCPGSDGGLVARLGMTEFAIQAGVDPPALSGTPLNKGGWGGSRIYPVERQYVAIALSGSALPDLLRQTCNVNFQALKLGDRPVVMTMMIGVSVTVIPGDRNGIPFYQVWGDRSYGPYLWQTLTGIVQELGGTIIGIDQI